MSSFSSDGEKLIYLPADEDYNIKIRATGAGELNYSVNEYSYDTATYSRIVNYNSIPIKAGDVLEGKAPRFAAEETQYTGDGSSTAYALSNGSTPLTPSADVAGEQARNSVYSITAKSDNPDGGTTLGGGAYALGSFAQVAALRRTL